MSKKKDMLDGLMNKPVDDEPLKAVTAAVDVPKAPEKESLYQEGTIPTFKDPHEGE